MALPLHVYGTAAQEAPYQWMVRLHAPFLLAWPASENPFVAARIWPKPTSWTPEVHNAIVRFTDFCNYPSQNLRFFDGQGPPQYLYVEEPDGFWAGVLDLWHGYLYVPDDLGLLAAVAEFRIPARDLKIPLEYGEAIIEAQRWHDDFITRPQFTQG